MYFHGYTILDINTTLTMHRSSSNARMMSPKLMKYPNGRAFMLYKLNLHSYPSCEKRKYFL